MDILIDRLENGQSSWRTSPQVNGSPLPKIGCFFSPCWLDSKWENFYSPVLYEKKKPIECTWRPDRNRVESNFVVLCFACLSWSRRLCAWAGNESCLFSSSEQKSYNLEAAAEPTNSREEKSRFLPKGNFHHLRRERRKKSDVMVSLNLASGETNDPAEETSRIYCVRWKEAKDPPFSPPDGRLPAAEEATNRPPRPWLRTTPWETFRWKRNWGRERSKASILLMPGWAHRYILRFASYLMVLVNPSGGSFRESNSSILKRLSLFYLGCSCTKVNVIYMLTRRITVLNVC